MIKCIASIFTYFTAMLTFTVVLGSSAYAQQHGIMEFQSLPANIRKHARSTRKDCRDLNPEHNTYDAMSGITLIDLEGDGVKEIMVDNLHLCNSHMAGANCTNRGCDLTIWKAKGSKWHKVLEEHLHNKFISIDRQTRRFQMIVATIYAGDERCKPDPKKDYTSGMSCDVIARYRQDGWHWRKIE